MIFSYKVHIFITHNFFTRDWYYGAMKYITYSDKWELDRLCIAAGLVGAATSVVVVGFLLIF